jgi:hypothetical protein
MLVKNVFIRCARWKLAEPYQCRFPDSPSAWLWNHLCNLATGTFNCCYPADGNLVYSRDTISRFEHKVTTGTTKRLGGKQQVTVILKTLDIGAHRVHSRENWELPHFAKPFERWRKKIRLNQIIPLTGLGGNLSRAPLPRENLGVSWARPGQKSNFRLIRRDALSLSPAAQAMPPVGWRGRSPYWNKWTWKMKGCADIYFNRLKP